MNRYFMGISLLCFFIYSCQPTLPIPDFQVEKVERLATNWTNSSPSFNLTLSSDHDMIKLFGEVKAANIYLFCPLSSTDFSAAAISKGGYCLRDYIFREDQAVTIVSDRYIYSFPVAFHGATLESFLPTQEIVKLLATTTCVDCKMVMSFLDFPPKKNRYSKQFCIPAKLFLDKL